MPYMPFSTLVCCVAILGMQYENVTHWVGPFRKQEPDSISGYHVTSMENPMVEMKQSQIPTFEFIILVR